MQTGLIVVRLVLAGVFVTAGIGKLLDLAGSRTALVEFGVPAPFVRSAAILLPLTEVAIAATLLIRPTAQWAAVAGAVLLAGFIAGISIALGRGRAPDCHCFGQIHSRPAGRGTLARNGALAAAACFVAAAGPGPALDGWASAGNGHAFVLAGLVVLGFGVLALARVIELRRRLERARGAKPPGLPIGARAPEFDATDFNGAGVSLGSLRARGKPVLLLFTHVNCPPCVQLLPDVSQWQAGLAEHLTIALIGQGDEVEHELLKSEHQVSEMYVQRGSAVFDAYKMGSTPSAVIVSVAGRVEGASVSGSFAIQELIRWSLQRQGSHRLGATSAAPGAFSPAVATGDPAPA